MKMRLLFTVAALLSLLALAAGPVLAQPFSLDFEAANPFSGGTLSGTQAATGYQSLYLGPGDTATLTLPDANLGGTVTMMVFDLGKWIDRTILGYPTNVYGPRWGVTNGTNCAGMTIIEKTFLGSLNGYGYSNEANTASWYSPAFYSPSRGRQATLAVNGNTGEEGIGLWTKWVFTFDPTGTVISMNMDGRAAVTDRPLTAPVTGIFLYGGRNHATAGLPLAGVYIDDVTWAPAAPPAVLTVNGGTGGGSYPAGTVVSISATVPAGQVFVNWTGDVAGVADVSAADTTITLTGDAVVTANFTNLMYTLTVTGGTGSGSYAPGTVVDISATLPPGVLFLCWTGDIATVADPFLATTTITMNGHCALAATVVPAPVVTVQAALSRNWVYQNTPATTGNRHLVYLSVTAGGTADFTVGVTKDPTSVGDVGIEATADPLVWIIRGSARQPGGTINTGLVKLNITVTDVPSSTIGAAQVQITCRPLGDIDAVGGVNGQDKLQMNKRLNGLIPDSPEYDLDGLGGSNGQDKLIINKILNGILIP